MFVVFAQAAMAGWPGEGALDDPTAREDSGRRLDRLAMRRQDHISMAARWRLAGIAHTVVSARLALTRQLGTGTHGGIATRGALRGESPRTRDGRNGPTAQNGRDS